MNRKVGLAAAAGVLLAVVSASTGGQAAPPTLSKDIQPIFDRSCTGCHGVKRQRAGLDLSAEKSFEALVNHPSAQVETLMRVKPGDPEHSYLVHKLEHRSAEGKGMPKGMFGSRSLEDAEIQMVKAWIAGGAKP